MAEPWTHQQYTEQHISHANVIPQLQPLLTSQQGIIVRVPDTGAKLRVLLEPAFTFNSYIRRDVYEKHFLKADGNAAKPELLNQTVRKPLLTSLNRTYRTSSAKVDLSASLADLPALSRPVQEAQLAGTDDEIRSIEDQASSESPMSRISSTPSADGRTTFAGQPETNLKRSEQRNTTNPVNSWARIASGTFPDAKHSSRSSSNATVSGKSRCEYSDNNGLNGNKENTETNEQSEVKLESQSTRNLSARPISYASIASASAHIPGPNSQNKDSECGARKLTMFNPRKAAAKSLETGPVVGKLPDGNTDSESNGSNQRLDAHVDGESDGFNTTNLSASSISWFDDDDNDIPSFESTLAMINAKLEEGRTPESEHNEANRIIQRNLMMSMSDVANPASYESMTTTEELTPTLQGSIQKHDIDIKDDESMIPNSAEMVAISNEWSLVLDMTEANNKCATVLEEIEILKSGSVSPIAVEVTEIVMDSRELSPLPAIDAIEGTKGSHGQVLQEGGLEREISGPEIAQGLAPMKAAGSAEVTSSAMHTDAVVDSHVESGDNTVQQMRGTVADIWDAPSIDVALPSNVFLKVLIESLPLTLSCCVVSELFPYRNDSAGFDIVMGARAFDYLPYLWVKHDPLHGFTVTQFHNRLQTVQWTDSIVKDKFLNHSQILAHPPSTAVIHVWIYSVMYDRETAICAENSAISGIGECDSKMSDRVACGYGIYFSKESAYNNLGTCEPKSQSFHEVVGLFEAVVNACTVQERKKDLVVVHTTSTYLYEIASRMDEYAKRDWTTKDGQPLTNGDMWDVLYKFINAVEPGNKYQRPRKMMVVKVNKRSSKVEQEYLKGAKTLAKIAAKNAIMHDLEAEGVAGCTVPDNANATTLEEFEQRVRTLNKKKPASKRPSKYKICHTIDWEREHKKVAVNSQSDPILDSYKVLTGDYSFNAEGSGGLYFRTTAVGGMTVCIEGKYLEEAWKA
ncbi:hypothetical protein V1525DRAFT_235715 [Lipomyces kononenkoae]|uniref:Uncharacterized protein n=1 Tax=Lipomyces kononenkoae TaxID=34357 RepID=A0ACC3SXF4_LIPKO